MSIFVHEFMGVHEVFFCVEYFDQVPSSEGNCSAKQFELSPMRILKSNPRNTLEMIHDLSTNYFTNSLNTRYMIGKTQ